MPIPALSGGLLPPGVHDCTVAEIKARFGAYALGSSRWDFACKLEAYLAEARSASIVAWVAVDGSFVTDKPDPNDVDVVIALREGLPLDAPLRPFEYNLISRRRVQQRYPFDVLVAPEGSTKLSEHMAFFQTDRQGRAKGILRVRP